MTNEYHFVTRWQFEGVIQEVYDLIHNAPSYPRWWPSVYLEVKEIAPGDERGRGRRIRLHTKGWLPYTLRWESRATEVERPRRLIIRASGDFDGRGIWTLEQCNRLVDVTFDWRIKADKPLLRYFSFFLKPAFAANHRWAMARGEESLRLELARRRARTADEANRIPAPPGPNRTSGLWLTLGTVIVLVMLAALFRLVWR